MTHDEHNTIVNNRVPCVVRGESNRVVPDQEGMVPAQTICFCSCICELNSCAWEALTGIFVPVHRWSVATDFSNSRDDEARRTFVYIRLRKGQFAKKAVPYFLDESHWKSCERCCVDHRLPLRHSKGRRGSHLEQFLSSALRKSLRPSWPTRCV